MALLSAAWKSKVIPPLGTIFPKKIKALTQDAHCCVGRIGLTLRRFCAVFSAGYRVSGNRLALSWHGRPSGPPQGCDGAGSVQFVRSARRNATTPNPGLTGICVARIGCRARDDCIPIIAQCVVLGLPC